MSRSVLLLSLVTLGGLTFSAGCHSSAPDPAANPPITQATAPDLKPLPSAAAHHPAPGSGKVNLDRSESEAAAHPGDVGAQRAVAFCYYRLQAYAQAVPAFIKVVTLAPDSIADRLYLGYSQMALGTLDDAVATFLSASEAKNATPADLASAYLEIGNCQWALGHDDQAAEAFSRSLASDPHEGGASLALGIYSAGAGKTALARTYLTAAVRDLPAGPERAQAYACIGRLDEEAKNTTAAAQSYREALALDPRNSWAKQASARLHTNAPAATR